MFSVKEFYPFFVSSIYFSINRLYYQQSAIVLFPKFAINIVVLFIHLYYYSVYIKFVHQVKARVFDYTIDSHECLKIHPSVFVKTSASWIEFKKKSILSL